MRVRCGGGQSEIMAGSPSTWSDGCIDTAATIAPEQASLSEANLISLREEVGLAVAGQPQHSLKRRWLVACNDTLHGAVCQVN